MLHGADRSQAHQRQTPRRRSGRGGGPRSHREERWTGRPRAASSWLRTATATGQSQKEWRRGSRPPAGTEWPQGQAQGRMRDPGMQLMASRQRASLMWLSHGTRQAARREAAKSVR